MKIIQFGIDASEAREEASMQTLKNLGWSYTRIENPRYDHEPPLDNILREIKIYI
tara:strand:- start:413 stop:577 length:165 start_codon:yes stop_codon:yes gene_type:complete